VYALAGLESGAAAVEVVHLFLERAGEPAVARYAAADVDALRESLRLLAAGVVDGVFAVSDEPCRELCAGCPGEGGLCSWPPAMTRRESPGQLF
jgi:hypothetical protein